MKIYVAYDKVAAMPLTGVGLLLSNNDGTCVRDYTPRLLGSHVLPDEKDLEYILIGDINLETAEITAFKPADPEWHHVPLSAYKTPENPVEKE